MVNKKHVRLSCENGVATLYLDRPPMNVMTIEMMEAINDELFSLREQRGLKVLLIRGSKQSFCGGIDVGEHTKSKVARMVHTFHRIFETMRLLELVSIAAVEGMALDGGFELALGCNMILASRSARFGLPEIGMGTFPPVASIVLPGAGPRRKAMEWILTGDDIGVDELAHYGLINRVFDDVEFDQRVDEFVAKIIDKSGAVLQLAKRAQVESYYSRWGEALYNVENLYLRELMSLSDPMEGINAFLANRTPKWTDS